ncbi:hypothetical protein XFF7767_1000078 [Xanthomonas citri pv. fuscans]|nr:hypothetical protein XFF7767_1000078 [Xanthomonas citri pv. fuscans]SON99458.1 hypothetical protein XFF6960_170105 [Xanthomonas citri pv. fuscans]SOO12601.1 hypothetical protein XFF7766_1120081 [Xanthomonas citri pv. fuscans]SOO43289.1 hypothetical protein XFF1815_330125 [Xanthomonas citri pv. fuscans]
MKQHFGSVARQRIRDEIVTTARNGAGAQDEIGTGMAGLGQCRIEGSIVIAHLPAPHDIGAGGTQLSQQITAGAIADLPRLQGLCGVADQLASRGNHGHARPPHHLHMRAAQAGEQHQMRTAQYGAGVDHAIVQAHVFAATADVLARTHRLMQADAAGAPAIVFEDLHLLDRHHRIGTGGHAGAGHDFPGCTDRGRTGILPCRNGTAHHVLAVCQRTNARGRQCKPIHCAVVEGRQLCLARQGVGEHAALGIGACHPLAGEGCDVRMDQRECFGIADHVQDGADQWMTRLGYRPLAQQVQARPLRRRMSIRHVLGIPEHYA